MMCFQCPYTLFGSQFLRISLSPVSILVYLIEATFQFDLATSWFFIFVLTILGLKTTLLCILSFFIFHSVLLIFYTVRAAYNKTFKHSTVWGWRLNIATVLLDWEVAHSWVHAVLRYVYLVAQSCPTVCSPMDLSPLGSSARGIFQARILEWVSISYSRGSSWPRDQTRVSCISCSYPFQRQKMDIFF